MRSFSRIVRLAGTVGTAWLCGMGIARASAGEPPLDSYAALVNNRVITVGEVLAMIQPIQQQLRLAYDGTALDAKLNEAFFDGMNSLIDRALILEEFVRQGGSLSDRAVDDYVSNMIHDKFNDDRIAFQETLALERMTISDWRSEMKDRLVVSLLRRKEVSDLVLISPAQIRAAYDAGLEKYRTSEQVKLRMIAINQGTTDLDRSAKRDEAEKILARLKGGEDFTAEAKSVSEGAKAAQGGDLGWIEPSSLRPELAAAVKELEPGQITAVIEAGNEFYILKVEALKKATVTPFEEVRGEIDKKLRAAEEERLYKAWIVRLKRRFYIKDFVSSQDGAAP